MKKGYWIQGIGIVGGLASILAFLQSVFPGVLSGKWMFTRVNLPVFVLALLLGITSVAVFWLGRFVYSHHHHHILPSDARSIMNYMLKNRLLDKSKRLDLCLYTAETLVTPWRAELQAHGSELDIRLLVRRPETDSKKHKLAEGCLDTVQEIAKANPKLNIDVRFYSHDPLLRLQIYEGGSLTCLAGLYRYDADHPMHFVGAEQNSMMVLKESRLRDREIISAIQSRFEHQWQTSTALRAVIFDMDGVLVNSMRYHHQSWAEAFKKAGVKFEEEPFRSDIYRLEGTQGDATVKELYKKYTGALPDGEMTAEIEKNKDKIYLELSHQASPFPGIFELLSFLKKLEVPLAVVTGTPRPAAKKILDTLFPGIFNILVSGSDVTKGKPHPLPFLTALEKLHIGNHDQCLVIENAPMGVKSAVAADIPVYGLLVDSPLDPKQLLDEGAKRVFHSHANLQQTLSQIHFAQY